MKPIVAAFALLAMLSFAAEQTLPTKYEPDLARWEVVNSPPRASWNEFYGFLSRAGYSRAEWMVMRKGDAVHSALGDGYVPGKAEERPKFSMDIPDGDTAFGEPNSVQKVSDGWLAGFNKGEFGAIMFWFGMDATQRYPISAHKINQFIAHGNRIFAVEGLAHMGASSGSLIEIVKGEKKWTAATFVELPDSGQAVTLLADGRFCIVTSGMLLAVSLDKRIEILVPKGEWGGLYPNSVAVDSKSEFAYIGMRQFVVRYNLRKNDHTFQYLLPSRDFLNKSFGP